ncbi:MAG: ATP-dependent Clp protease adaptor ClpS [Pirellulales bacterium]
MAADEQTGNAAFADGPGTATLVPATKPVGERKKRRIPRYHVILWDSDDHTYDYVERMLRELFGHTQEECHKMAETVDTQGKVVVLTTTKEHAELKRDQIIAYGKDDAMKNCKGSMHATIESAP